MNLYSYLLLFFESAVAYFDRYVGVHILLGKSPSFFACFIPLAIALPCKKYFLSFFASFVLNDKKFILLI